MVTLADESLAAASTVNASAKRGRAGSQVGHATGMRRCARAGAAIACLLLSLSSNAQEDSQELPPDYIPLFSKEQIEQAAPEAKARMIQTEERNRKAWIERSKRRSSGDTPVPPEGSEQTAAAPPPPKKRKIYRWVDAEGRVNFGDTPPQRKHEEVKVRGAQPPIGATTQPRRLITESE